MAFNCQWEGENIGSKINHNNIALLFAWPGILMMQLAQITGDASYKKNMHELNDLLDSGTDYNQIWSYLNAVIEPKPTVPAIVHEKIKNAIKSNNLNENHDLRKELNGYLPKLFLTMRMLMAM